MDLIIENPKPCPRVGNVFTIRVDELEKLENTVLHQLVHPDQHPTLMVGKQRLTLPPLGMFKLEPKARFDMDGTKVGEFIDLPDVLRAVDTLIGYEVYGILNVSKQVQKTLLITTLSRLIERDIVHARSEKPGMMGFVMGSDNQLKDNEMAISLHDAKTFIREIIKDNDKESIQLIYDLCDRLDEEIKPNSYWVHSQYQLPDGDRDLDPPTARKVINSLATALDGVSILGLRYPNASSTSHSLYRLRIYKSPPGNYVFMKIKTLIRNHQGDCDGDRVFWHYAGITDLTIPSSPLDWTREYAIARTISLDDLVVPAKKHQLEIMKGFSERGKWVGMLTYYFWLLAYSAAHAANKLGYIHPEDVVPDVLDLFTPLIEGVMNTRKGEGSGYSAGESLAENVCNMFSGNRDFLPVLEMLPVKEDGIYDEEKFNKKQIEFLKKILTIVAGETQVGNTKHPNTRCKLNNTVTGACQSPVLLAFAGRFSPRATVYLLESINYIEFCQTITNNIMLKTLSPWSNETQRTVSSIPLSDQEIQDYAY